MAQSDPHDRPPRLGGDARGAVLLAKMRDEAPATRTSVVSVAVTWKRGLLRPQPFPSKSLMQLIG